jgi:hypothetical protein
MLFKNNITFAVLEHDTGWRNDLTIRFVEYFAYALIEEDPLSKVLYTQSVDEALKQCETDYLLVVSSGSTLPEWSFFSVLSEQVEKQRDIFISKLVLVEDYAAIDSACVLFNIPLWKEHGEMRFSSQVREGPRFGTLIEGDDKYEPNAIIVKTGEDNSYIPPACSMMGGGIVAKQLEVFGEASALFRFINHGELFYLSKKTPYYEIRTETLFEKKFLASIPNRAFLNSGMVKDNEKTSSVDVVVAPAQGLKPHTLAEQFSAKHLIVYDYSKEALALQKLIFSVKKPMLYSALVEKFLHDNPSARVMDDWTAEAHSVVVPLKGVKVEYFQVDACSFEMEELVESFDKSVPALFDVSDIFVYPFNFYKRPFYQIQGLFAELFSKIKSRTGPSHIIGLAPGFIRLDDMHVNTSTEHFTKLWEIPRIEEPEVVHPELLGDATEEQAAPSSNLPAWVSNVAPPLKEQEVGKTFVSRMAEKIVNWIKDEKKEVLPPRVEPVEPIISQEVEEKTTEPEVSTVTQSPIAKSPGPELPQPVAHVDKEMIRVAVEPQIPLQQRRAAKQDNTGAGQEAISQGYEKNRRVDNVRGIRKNLVVYTKVEKIDEFSALFEYSVDEAGGWSFKVSKVGSAKKIEFSNGTNDEAMLRHLRQPVKINAKTALKFL